MAPRPASPPPAVAPATRGFSRAVAGFGAFLLALNLVWTALTPQTADRWYWFLFVLGISLLMALSPGTPMQRGRDVYTRPVWEWPIFFGVSLAPGQPLAVAACLTLAVGAQSLRGFLAGGPARSRALVHFGSGSMWATASSVVAVTYPPVTLLVATVLAIVIDELVRYGYDRSHGPREHEYAEAALRNGLGKRLLVPVAIATVLSTYMALTGFGAIDQLDITDDLGIADGFTHKMVLLCAPVLLVIAERVRTALILHMEDEERWNNYSEAISSFANVPANEANVVPVVTEAVVRVLGASSVDLVLPASYSTGGARYTRRSGPNEHIEVVMLSREEELPPTPSTGSVKRVPLLSNDREIGYMVVRWDHADRRAQNRRDRMIRPLTYTISALLVNAIHAKQQERAASEKAREAQTDTLTGLGNRSLLAEQGPALLSDSRDARRACVLLLLDLDGFKRINDTLGHAAGDQVLREVGARLRDNVRGTDIAIRLGGDEFAVLATDMTSAEDADILAAQLAGALAPPVEVSGMQLTVEASIGIAVHGQDGNDVETLLQMADIAMYEAKRRGRGQAQHYSRSLNSNSTEALRLTTDLRSAITSPDQLVLHYQPKLDIAADKVVGMEALVRWVHPELGLLPPDKFVPLAEHSGLIRAFTLAILERAVADRARVRAYLPGATVSVNISAHNLLDAGLPSDVADACRRHGVPPGEVVLEVTESVRPGDRSAADRIIRGLAAVGCVVSMDDFGHGYSTIEALGSGLPFGEIKLDRLTMERIHHSRRLSVVLQSLVEIGRAYDCKVVAEGVENEEMLEMLRQVGCHQAQGFYIKEPLPLADLMAWISERGECPALADGALSLPPVAPVAVLPAPSARRSGGSGGRTPKNHDRRAQRGSSQGGIGGRRA